MSEEGHEHSLTIGLLGSNHEITKLIGESLGSPGTRSDLQFYNRLDGKLNRVFTAVSPIAYPEKIKSLIQVCALNRIHVMIIDAETGITPEIGEIMVVMDIFKKHFGTKYIAVIGGINAKNEWQIEEIRKKLPLLLKTTSLSEMEIVPLRQKEDYDRFKEALLELETQITYKTEAEIGYSKVLIDHAFPVKGVGTVVLGLVETGTIYAGKMYDLVPVQNKIILRSIQKQDRDFPECYAGDRVGLALKGIKADQIDRNCVFCTMGTFTKSKKLKIKFSVEPYYKPIGNDGKISCKENKTYHLVSDLAITPVKLLNGEDIGPGQTGILDVELEHELPHDKNGMRGLIADFGPFEKKLRVVGYFEQEI